MADVIEKSESDSMYDLPEVVEARIEPEIVPGNDQPQEISVVEEIPQVSNKKKPEKWAAKVAHNTHKIDSRNSSAIGLTRKDKSSTKKAVKLASKSRKINQKRANKKSRATGSKKRV